MGKPENLIESYLRKQAGTLGFLCYKFTSPGNNGVPDRVLIGHGYTFFVETKKDKTEAPRQLQKQIINRMIDNGALVYVMADKTDIDNLLQSFVDNAPIPPVYV